MGTSLTEIDGIGEKTAEKLLTHFKSVAGVKRASKESIESVVGKSVALKLNLYFNPVDPDQN